MEVYVLRNMHPTLTPEQRAEQLAIAVSRHVAEGARVESNTGQQAVLVRGRRPNHLLHLILGLVTCSLWWICVWLPIVLFGGEKRVVLSVDQYGNVQTAKGRG